MNISKDKLLHILAGFLLALSVSSAAGVLLFGLASAIIGGAAKEFCDLISNKLEADAGRPPLHDVDVMDFAFTVLGGLFGALLGSFLSHLFF